MAQRHQIPTKVRPIVGLAALVSSASGCDEWPRYAHKPSTEADALSPEAAPSDGVEINWGEAVPEIEPNNAPIEAIELSLLDGHISTGELSGLGWNADAPVTRVSDCENVLAFPPDAPGTYTGDVDWITIQPEDAGVLCLTLNTEPDDEISTDTDDARLDAVLYTLDDCAEPIALFVQDGTDTPIGSNMPVGTVQWAIGIEADKTVAVGIAGFWPDDDTLSLPWSAHLSLVPGIAAAPGALCPEVD